ncbi:MAG TPA: SUMF1/EgtB/PvdO family nonheme iron enzyme [Polyangiaceae bacterium]|nr:SUMF1/EgtB/PvdO family nonheme iron enzyme [Polyangiaceae bacterium]
MIKALLSVAILVVSLGMAAWLVHSRKNLALQQAGQAVGHIAHTGHGAHTERRMERGAQPLAIRDHSASDVTAQAPSDENALSVAACVPGMVFVAATPCAKADCVPAAAVCIDRYEYPNLAGAMPATMTNFSDGERACAVEGKRLCTEQEWTRACLPPAEADGKSVTLPQRCNFGPAVKAPEPTSAKDEDVAGMLQALDRRVPSGAMADCVSSVGAHDLLGNLQEWVASGDSSSKGGLKGGHFASVETDCRDVSYASDALTRRPFNGFRCCSQPLIAVGQRTRPARQEAP